jgi:putative ABC transport system permease protein
MECSESALGCVPQPDWNSRWDQWQTSYVVAARKKSSHARIGIRMALGANKEDILRLVLGLGLKLTFARVSVGLAASFALTHYLGSLLLGVTRDDPALRRGSLRLLHPRARPHACGPDGRAALPIKER